MLLIDYQGSEKLELPVLLKSEFLGVENALYRYRKERCCKRLSARRK